MKVNDEENKKLLLANKIIMALSMLLLAIALLGLFGKPQYTGTTISSFFVGSSLLVFAYLNQKRITAELEGKTIADERSRRVGEKSGLVAYLLLVAALLVSGLINSIFNLGLEYTFTVNAIIIASVLSWLIIGLYIDKKGEVS